MTAIWNATGVTPAATNRLPVDVSSSGGASRVTMQQLADLGVLVGESHNALGTISSGTNDIDLSLGGFVSATIGGALTFTFSNPPASPNGCEWVLVLTNGGSAVVTWPGSVTWVGGTAPTLQASGIDVLRFYTVDGGTSWIGELAFDESGFLSPSDIASGTITPRADDIDLSGGTDGDVLTVQADGSLALETPAGGGSPAGLSGQGQYNNAGSFDGMPLWRVDANTIAQQNGTTAQVHYIYKTTDGGSNYERLNLNPNAATNWMRIGPASAGTGSANISMALGQLGTGAISAHVPDSTSAGGNARGSNAVDWSSTRDAATKVASGTSSTIGGGYANTASAMWSTVGGGVGNSATGQAATASGGQANTASGARSCIPGGQNNTASGVFSAVSGGDSNTASGNYSWIPGGYYGSTRGLAGTYAYASQRRSATGDSQIIGQVQRGSTTDATPKSISVADSVSALTVMVLPANSTLLVTALVVARDTSGNSAGWRAEALFKRDGSNNTSRLGSATVTAIGTPDAALSTATIDLIANDTLESAQIEVTGVAATTIYWVGELKCAQVA